MSMIGSSLSCSVVVAKPYSTEGDGRKEGLYIAAGKRLHLFAGSQSHNRTGE